MLCAYYLNLAQINGIMRILHEKRLEPMGLILYGEVGYS